MSDPRVHEGLDGRPPTDLPREIVVDNRSSVVDDRRWKLPRLAVLLALAGVFAIELVFFAASTGPALDGSTDGGASGATNVALFASMLAFVAIAVTGIPRLLPGAERIVVRETGLHLIYARGRTVPLPWGGSSGAVLRDFSADPVMAAANLAYHLSGPHFWSRRTLVSRSTERAIRVFAEDHGTTVSRRSVKSRWNGAEIVVYRFGGPGAMGEGHDGRSFPRAP